MLGRGPDMLPTPANGVNTPGKKCTGPLRRINKRKKSRITRVPFVVFMKIISGGN
jgi:hypothetical protein